MQLTVMKPCSSILCILYNNKCNNLWLRSHSPQRSGVLDVRGAEVGVLLLDRRQPVHAQVRVQQDVLQKRFKIMISSHSLMVTSVQSVSGSIHHFLERLCLVSLSRRWGRHMCFEEDNNVLFLDLRLRCGVRAQRTAVFLNRHP